MNAAVIAGLVALFIPGCHCQPQVTSSSSALETVQFQASSINKRQEMFQACLTSNLQDFLASIPQDCRSQIIAVFGFRGALNTSAAAALTEAYRVICEPRCGNSLIVYYNRCNTPQANVDFVRGFCTRNNANRLCYQQLSTMSSDWTQAMSNCSSQSSTNCTTDCRNALTTFASNSGCCINIYNTTLIGINGSSIPPDFRIQDSLWSTCGVNTPGFCNLETSTLNSTEAPTTQSSTEAPTIPSSAGVPKFAKVIFLWILVVMAMLLF